MTEYTVQIRRPDNIKLQKDFARTVLAERWGIVHKIKLGRYREPVNLMVSWCLENIENEWSHSDGGEVFYFENDNDAVWFKLRWFTTTTYED